MRKLSAPFVLTTVLAAALVGAALAGCSGRGTGVRSGTAPGGGAGAGGVSSAESTSDVMSDAYPAITPESPNEKAAVANLGKAIKMRADNQRLTNKQTGRNEYVFTNEQGLKPSLIGYRVALLSDRRPNGKWGSIDLVVLDGKVTTLAMWDKSAGVTRTNGMMMPSFFALEFGSDPAAYTKGLAPSSPGEKAAVAMAASWAKANVADLGFTKAPLLVGYAFEFGGPTDRPNVFIAISPDGLTSESTGNWPDGWKP